MIGTNSIQAALLGTKLWGCPSQVSDSGPFTLCEQSWQRVKAFSRVNIVSRSRWRLDTIIVSCKSLKNCLLQKPKELLPIEWKADFKKGVLPCELGARLSLSSSHIGGIPKSMSDYISCIPPLLKLHGSYKICNALACNEGAVRFDILSHQFSAVVSIFWTPSSMDESFCGRTTFQGTNFLQVCTVIVIQSEILRERL